MQPQRFCEEIRLTDKDNTIDVKGLSVSSGKLVLGDASATILFPANINPSTDNARQIGDSTHRLAAIYALSISGGASTVLINSIGFAPNQQISSYANITTAGMGLPVICAVGRATAQTASNASIATYTTPIDGTFEISANVLFTRATTFSIDVQVTFTDEAGASHTYGLPFSYGSTAIYTLTNGTVGAAVACGTPLHIRAKSNTAITVLTSGTFTTVTYNVEAVIKQTV